jgi:hypothetical protein
MIWWKKHIIWDVVHIVILATILGCLVYGQYFSDIELQVTRNLQLMTILIAFFLGSAVGSFISKLMLLYTLDWPNADEEYPYYDPIELIP